jgi:hypothetical protein
MFNQNNTPLNQYIFFDSDTLGNSGRKVYIDPGLITRYFELVDRNSHDGKQVEEKIKSLRSLAGGLTAQSNQNNATEHRQDCGNVMVTYKILQHGDGHSHGDGVYITNLKQAYKKGKADRPGFHLAKFSMGGRSDWKTEDITGNKIPTAIGAIGSAYHPESCSYDLEMSANRMGKFIANKDSKRLNNQFSLYYAPSYIIEGLATWKTPEQKMSAGNAGPKELARILIDTQNSYWGDGRDPHHWYVFGDGNKLLDQALKEVKNQGQQSLNYHQFHLVSPRVNMGILLQQLKHLDAKVSSTVADIAAQDMAAKLHQAHNHDAVINGLQRFDRSWGKMDSNLTPTSNFLQKAQKKLTANLAQGSFSQLTFTGLADKLAGTLQGW